MRKIFFHVLLAGLVTLMVPTGVQALGESSPTTNIEPILIEENEASEAATTSAEASISAIKTEARQQIQEKREQDLTEATGKKADTLTVYLEENANSEFYWWSWLQYMVRTAVNHGLPANIVVLILMFPLVACLIAFSRHVVGLRGFGIYAPAVLSVAFVSTGIGLGIVIFLAVIFLAILMKKLFQRTALPYLPKTALLLWGISIGVLGLLVGAAALDWQFFLQISIFPLLIIILLSENFMETQLFSNSKEALKLTLETIVIAVICALIINSETLQKLVIIHPGLTLMLTALANVLIGKFTGLRLLEYFRFKSLLRNKK